MYKLDYFKIIVDLGRVSLLLIALGPTQYSASRAQGAKINPLTLSELSARSPSTPAVEASEVAETDRKNSSTFRQPVESNTASVSSPATNVDLTYLAQGPAEGSPSESGVSRGSAVVPNNASESDLLGYLTSTPAIVLMSIGLVFLLFLRRKQSNSELDIFATVTDEFGFTDFDTIEVDEKPAVQAGLIKSTGSNGGSAPRKSTLRLPVALPPSLFGAYQVDQEVAKLVLGQPHKMEVLGSRASDDRRAMEASLLKALASTDEDEQRRVRAALEEYGFVARQNAAVLMAADPYDRTSAARMLGYIKSASALPFLLEALYDNESIVRNQAVLSIGELRLPAAIGALLDIARKHSDVPGALLTRALSACSVEGLCFFDSPLPEPGMLSPIDVAAFASEIKRLKPASAVQDLPESVDDEKFAEALAKLEALEIAERPEGIKLLAQFAVRESVAALARVARRDAKPNLRALAIGSLATINHESVFPSVLIGMADESREVRAAAARALSRLSFDRADAYARVMEADDAGTLRDVAQACVKAGVAAQAIDRLGSSDRRQAYEALSLVSLLAKADVLEPIVAAIMKHSSVEVRIGAVRVLGTIDHPTVLDELREIPLETLPEPVKMALAETIADLEAAMNQNSQVTEIEESAEPDHSVDGNPKQPALDSAESWAEQYRLGNTEFGIPPVGIEDLGGGTEELGSWHIESSSEQSDLEGTQFVASRDELEEVEFRSVAEKLEAHNLESLLQESEPTGLESYLEQPLIDTPGLPARRIA